MSEKILVKKDLTTKTMETEKKKKHVLKKWPLLKKKTLDKKKTLWKETQPLKKTHEKITPWKNSNLFDWKDQNLFKKMNPSPSGKKKKKQHIEKKTPLKEIKPLEK